MTIDINQNSGLVGASTPGYSACGCGNRRYYTKSEIDEMMKGVLDPEEIEAILDQMFTEYIEGGDLYQLILNAIGDVYSKEQIDALLLGKLDVAAFTQAMAAETARTENVYAKKGECATTGWVENQNYLKDITLTINGTELHNNGSIIIEGGGTGGTIDLSDYAKTTAVTEAINTAIATETGRTEDVYAKKTDLAGKLDTTAFTQFQAYVTACCENVMGEIEMLHSIVDYLQAEIDDITSGDTPETGSTPDTGTGMFITAIYNVNSTSEATKIFSHNDRGQYFKSVTIDGVTYDTTRKSKMDYTFSQTGEQSVLFECSNGQIPNWAFYETRLARVTIPNGITTIGKYAFGYTLLTGITIPNSVTSISEGALQFNYDPFTTKACTLVIGTGLTSIGSWNAPRYKGTTTITLNATNPPTVTGDRVVFPSLNDNTLTVYVPANSVNAYKSTTNLVLNSNVIQAKP